MSSAPRSMTPADGAAWVVGASSGIGKAIALELARRGWSVAISARREAELAKVVAEAAGSSGRIIAHVADVTDSDGLAACHARIEDTHGPVALAIFNAGIAPYIRAPNLDLRAVRQVFDVNTIAVYNGMAAVLPAMTTRGKGHVAVTGSMAGYGGLPKAAAYGATKAAVIHLCEALKFDCDNLGIKLQLISPGFIKTPLTDDNDFPMPFLLSEEEAGRRCVDGLATSRFEIVFPRRLAYVLKAVNLLPYWLYFPLVAAATGWKRRGD